jgi:peptide/nickel transport system permease protein
MSVASLTARPRVAPRITRALGASGSLRLGVGLMIALLLLGVFATTALVDAQWQDLGASYLMPGSPGHRLGTDPLGRDMLAWIGAGVFTSLRVSIGVVAVSALVGGTVGLVAGYAGGVLDATLMRLSDLQLSVPPLPLFIAASAVLPNTLLSLVILLSIVGWVPYARLVRARVLVERERGFVAAARLAGTPPWRILLVHLLPTIVTEVAVLGSLQAGIVLLWEAGLSFLGLGLQPPYTSLGFMISQGRTVLSDAWWIVAMPGIVIVLLVLAFNLIGDGLRDAFKLDVDVFGR